jgi:hypothetical protein
MKRIYRKLRKRINQHAKRHINFLTVLRLYAGMPVGM